MVIRRDGSNQSISTISRLWEPLAYPLLFPHGTLGWGIYGALDDFGGDRTEETGEVASDIPTRQIMHYRARMLREPRFQIFGRLTNEYAIDMFTRNLETRLNYIRAIRSTFVTKMLRLWVLPTSLIAAIYIFLLHSLDHAVGQLSRYQTLLLLLLCMALQHFSSQ